MSSGEGATVLRLAPPDRRGPVPITAGSCPQNFSCYCCPLATEKWHGNPRSNRTCQERHPASDRMCSQPYPEGILACPERKDRPQEAPEPPAGFRRPRMSCCVECGRITARRWTDRGGQVLPWCAGQFPKPEEITEF